MAQFNEALKIQSGTLSIPSLLFSSAVSTGMYLNGTNSFSLVTNNAISLTVAPLLPVIVSNGLRINGTTSSPQPGDILFENNTLKLFSGSLGLHINSDAGVNRLQILPISSSTSDIRITGTSSIKIPAGLTSERPSSPIEGDFRINLETNKLEFYNSSWISISATNGYAENWLSSDPAIKTINHNLNSYDVMVEVYDTLTNSTIDVDIDRTTLNSLTLTSTEIPPNTWRVLVIKVA
jgi:hypothetical protein